MFLGEWRLTYRPLINLEATSLATSQIHTRVTYECCVLYTTYVYLRYATLISCISLCSFAIRAVFNHLSNVTNSSTIQRVCFSHIMQHWCLYWITAFLIKTASGFLLLIFQPCDCIDLPWYQWSIMGAHLSAVYNRHGSMIHTCIFNDWTRTFTCAKAIHRLAGWAAAHGRRP